LPKIEKRVSSSKGEEEEEKIGTFSRRESMAIKITLEFVSGLTSGTRRDIESHLGASPSTVSTSESSSAVWV
jgi:hypothetical protein